MAEAVGEISLDLLLDDSKFDKSMSDLENKTKGFGGKLGTAAKAGVAAVGAATVAAGKAIYDVASQSVNAYADYEQLVGGVETLFGAGGQSLEEYAKSVGKTVSEAEGEYNALMNAQSTVMNNAAEAYKTAGLTANEYMETVTGFSASLIQSLGGDTEKAAEISNQAIVDMSDNANKMGSSMESIQNAYAGFAKQNYTMLDNLKLGYGGTKEEMQRLLEDAQKLTGIEYNIENYADVINAIHAIQEEMGIAGTTAKEAGSTIQGSLTSAKSAWGNLVTGLSDENANLDKLIDEFIDSAGVALDNLIPVVEKALEGISELLEKLIPKLGEKLPGLVEKILPGLLEAFSSVVKSIVAALPELLKILIPVVIEVAIELFNAIVEILPDLILTLVDAIIENIPIIINGLIEALPALIAGLIQIVVEIAARLPEICAALIEAIPLIVEAIIEAFSPLGDGVGNLFSNIFTGIQEFFAPFTEWFDANFVQPIVAYIDFLWSIIENILNIIEAAIILLVQKIQEIVGAIVGWIDENIIQPIVNFFTILFDTIWNALLSVIEKIKEPLLQIGTWIYDNVIKPVLGFFDMLWDGITSGIKTAINFAIGIVEGFVNGIIKAINLFLNGINGLSKVASLVTGNNVSSIGNISEVSLPRLAQGGYVEANSPQIAMIGDNKHEGEIVSPESKIAEAVATGVKTAMSMLLGSQAQLAGAGGGDIVIPVILDGNELERVIVTAEQRRNARNGGRY